WCAPTPTSTSSRSCCAATRAWTRSWCASIPRRPCPSASETGSARGSERRSAWGSASAPSSRSPSPGRCRGGTTRPAASSTSAARSRSDHPAARQGGARRVKAAFFKEHGGADKIQYDDYRDPVAGAGEAVVRVRACALNHVDMLLLDGRFPPPEGLPHV